MSHLPGFHPIDISSHPSQRIMARLAALERRLATQERNPGGDGGSGTVPAHTHAEYLPYTAFDVKGDLLVGTGSDAMSRLARGSDGQVLTVDSSQPTGLKWTTAVAGGSGSGSTALNARLWYVFSGDDSKQVTTAWTWYDFASQPAPYFNGGSTFELPPGIWQVFYSARPQLANTVLGDARLSLWDVTNNVQQGAVAYTGFAVQWQIQTINNSWILDYRDRAYNTALRLKYTHSSSGMVVHWQEKYAIAVRMDNIASGGSGGGSRAFAMAIG